MIPFSPPRTDEKTVEAVAEVLRSGWITTGPKTKEFEKRLTQYSSCDKTLCVSSASAGLELMLRWFGIGEGDEVIVPAYTYAASANVVVHCGAKVVFVDSNLDDFNINIEKTKAAITSKTKVIIPVDIAGMPCDYDRINALVREEEIKSIFAPKNEVQKKLGRILVLADAAHSVGATYKTKKSGSLTDITVFSFHAVKNLTTAEGGAICLKLPEIFDAEEEYINLNTKSLHGQNKDALSKLTIGNWRYDIVEAGYKFNMTDIQAAMGLVELDRYDEDMLLRRKFIFERYCELFRHCNHIDLPLFKDNDRESSYHVFLLRIKNISEKVRDSIIEEIYKNEVAVNVHFVPLPMMTFYKNEGYDINNYPNAYYNYSHEISLPVYYDLSDDNIEIVANTVLAAIKKHIG
ncbi:MAG: DegT/DnrJ/EryC1/StrS aminotransferase family protein [Bacteroidales bacterium]|nr:DegT/DnrJ/EryC1/StrS aminotransferase family protein [Bacteroidales bacterium]